jgi:subtilisin family serine protease
VGGTFDPISFGAFYRCAAPGIPATWTFEVQTADSWTTNSLGDWQVFIDTDGNFSDNCSGNEYIAYVAQSGTTGKFVAQVQAVNSICQPVATMTLPTADFTITSNSVALSFPSSDINSSNTLVWNALLQSRSEEQTSNGGDLVPSETFMDSSLQGVIADSVPPNTSPTCPASITTSSGTQVATTSNSRQAAAVLRKAGFGHVHDYGQGIVSFTGDRAAAQRVLEAAGLGTQVAPGHVFKPATVTSPNDPAFASGSQWNLGVIGASGGSGAWSMTNGSGVVVADIDTGVDYTQPDLAATVGSLTSAAGTSSITSLAVSPVVQTIAPGATIMLNAAGGHTDYFTTSSAVALGATAIPVTAQTPSFNYLKGTSVVATNLVPGFDAITQTAMGPGTNEQGNTDAGQSDAGHGTAVAGVIAALTGNDTGLASLGFNSKVLPIKVNFDGQADISAQIAAGINWAVDPSHTLHPSFPVKVINLSLGGPCVDTTIQTAIQAAQSAGILVLAAAGNGALNSTLDPNNGENDLPSFPADLSGVIAVGATGRDGFRAAYSDTGSYVSMVAPGGSAIPGQPGSDLPLLAPHDQCPVPPCFTTGAGTSFATAQVSAAAALIWSVDPTLTASEVSGLLLSTTTDLGVSGTPDLAYGNGLENARAAVADAGPLDHLVLSPAAATIKAGTAQAYTAAGANSSGNSLGDFTSLTTFTIAPNGPGTGASCDNTAKTCTAIQAGTYTVTGTQSGRTGTATLAVISRSEEAVSSWAAGRLDLFARGADNAIWHAAYAGGWSGWESLGGVVTSSPAAVSWAPNRIDLFAVGTDGRLYHRAWAPGWTPWASELGAPPPGIAPGSSPAVSSWAPGRLDVFVRGGDNAIWHAAFAGGWSGWESLGGVVTSSPAAVSWAPNRIDLFAVGTDGRLYHRAWVPGWTGWASELGAPPPGISPGSGLAVSSWALGRLDVFVRGGDNAVWHAAFAGGWSGWESLGGVVTSGPAAVSWASNRIDLFGVGTNGGSFHKVWNGSAWGAWVADTGVPPPGLA